MRYSAQSKSRTRRDRRSYQMRCAVPEVPQIAFLPAHEGDEPRTWLTTPRDALQRAKSWKGICPSQSAAFD